MVPPALQAQEIWLVPGAKDVDLPDMFRPGAPWEKAASATQVVGLYGNPFINPVPQEQLNAIVADLNRRHIGIAVETGVMDVPAKPRPACGGWGYVEGYGPVALHELIAKKIKQAGGTIKYIAMDEPLWFGHYFRGRPGGQPGCQSPIEEVARLAASSLKAYIRAFPDVRIGDIEPANLADISSNQGRSPDWQEDLQTWATAFRAATGRPLAFLQIDVGWIQANAIQHARMVYDDAGGLLRRQLLGNIGIIYNGNPTDSSDAAWVQSARDHMTLMEGDYRMRPGQVVIQTWHPHPSHALPESSPEALTSLVDFYTAHPWAK
jgi:hypothetical protein